MHCRHVAVPPRGIVWRSCKDALQGWHDAHQAHHLACNLEGLEGVCRRRFQGCWGLPGLCRQRLLSMCAYIMGCLLPYEFCGHQRKHDGPLVQHRQAAFLASFVQMQFSMSPWLLPRNTSYILCASGAVVMMSQQGPYLERPHPRPSKCCQSHHHASNFCQSPQGK